MTRLEEIRTRLNNATTGPWIATKTGITNVYGEIIASPLMVPTENDLTFLSNAYTDLQYLLDYIQEQEGNRG